MFFYSFDSKKIFSRVSEVKQYEIQSKFGRQEVAGMIDSDLSPENLSCDGELPRSQVQARYRALTSAAKELQKLDPSVKFYEFA